MKIYLHGVHHLKVLRNSGQDGTFLGSAETFSAGHQIANIFSMLDCTVKLAEDAEQSFVHHNNCPCQKTQFSDQTFFLRFYYWHSDNYSSKMRLQHIDFEVTSYRRI